MDKEFYAVFIEDKYYTEGDERSRTNPGHGYPGGWTNYISVLEFKTKEELERWIFGKHNTAKYRVVKCTPIEVKKTIEIKY